MRVTSSVLRHPRCCGAAARASTLRRDGCPRRGRGRRVPQPRRDATTWSTPAATCWRCCSCRLLCWLLMRTEATGSSMTAAGFGLVAGLALYAHFFTAPPLGVALLWLVAGAPPARASLALGGASVRGPRRAGGAWFFLLRRPRAGTAAPRSRPGDTRLRQRRVAHRRRRRRGLTELLPAGRPLVVLAALLARGAVGRERSWWLLGVGATSVLGLVAVVASQSEPSIFSARYLSVALPFLGLAVAASVGPDSPGARPGRHWDSSSSCWSSSSLALSAGGVDAVGAGALLLDRGRPRHRRARPRRPPHHDWSPFEGIVARHVMLRAEPVAALRPVGAEVGRRVRCSRADTGRSGVSPAISSGSSPP